MLPVVLALLVPAAPQGARVDIGVGTVAPVYLGAQAIVELPGRVLVSGELGYMPHAYVSVNNSFHDDGFDNDFVNDGRKGGFVRSTLGSALVIRPSIGIRPIPWSGMEVMAGYTRIGALSRESTGSRSFLPRIDALHVTVGWAWQVRYPLYMRTSLGWMFPVSVSTGERAEQTNATDLYGRTDAVAQYKNIFRSPTLALMLCYRFE